VNPPIVVPGFSTPIIVGQPDPRFHSIIVTQPPVIRHPGRGRHFRNRQVFVPGGQVIVPGGVFVTGGGIVSGTVVVPDPAVVVPAVPGGHFTTAPIGSGGVLVGTPKDQVLRQFGEPVVTVWTRDGETLHFKNGVTVFIQNGQVSRPE
jgi:hypothetical protein